MKHLSFDDRLTIQKGLRFRQNFAQIAAEIGKDRSTVSREVKKHRVFTPYESGNICIHRKKCDAYSRCQSRQAACHNISRCRNTCGLCNLTCSDFKPEQCMLTDKPPYVCNGCEKKFCYLGKWRYDAKLAQKQAEETLHESRKGISLSDEDFNFLNKNIVPLVKKGVAVSVACETYRDQMPVCTKTMYSYIDKRVFELDNLDLRLKVRRPLRKKSGPKRKIDKHCYEGRTYKDYNAYMQQNPSAVVCQMDTVEGKKGGKVMLTLYFQSCGLQLLYMRERNDSASVIEIFSQLRKTLGDDFKKVFQVILTDRGTEFSNPQAIECNPETGERECRVFYCDPGKSNQKSECEKNHEFVRYIFPKGTSLDRFTQEDAALAMNNINSYARAKWALKTPMEMFTALYGPQIAQKLGLVKIEVTSLCLTPDLVK